MRGAAACSAADVPADEFGDAGALGEALRTVAQDHGTKPQKLMPGLRYAITAQKVGPNILDTMAVLGKAATVHRLRAALAAIGDEPGGQ